MIYDFLRISNEKLFRIVCIHFLYYIAIGFPDSGNSFTAVMAVRTHKMNQVILHQLLTVAFCKKSRLFPQCCLH